MSAKERLKSTMSKESVTLLPCFYFVELPILASSVVSLYFLELTDLFKPVHSGYSCNDRTLSMPYVEPSKEVVPFLMLFSLAFIIPAATIMIGEGILYCCQIKRRVATKTEANINAAGCNFNSFIRRAVRFVGVHIFGLCVTALITDIIQLCTGYHAPYFLTVCKPNLTALNATCDGNAFIVEDICAGSNSIAINTGRKSFPSQHATLAAFAAVYVSMYFNATLTDSSKLLKPLLVFSFIMCGVICGLTRIIQFKNHAMDVYCGFLIGGAIAVYLGLYAVGNFKPSEDTSLRQHPRPPQPQPRPQPQPPPMQIPPQPQPIGPPSGLREPLRQLPNFNADIPRLLQAKSLSVRERPTSARSESILLRGPSRDASSFTMKRASTELQCITTSGLCPDSMVTFSNTLPRTQSVSGDEPVPRRHAAIHASMDSMRSKQLLSQWKTKNETRKMQCGEGPETGMEVQCSSEPSAMSLEGPPQYMKMAASVVPLPVMVNHNGGAVGPGGGGGGGGGGARVTIQSRPGSSQLVHIPEEVQESSCTSPQGDGGEPDDGGEGSAVNARAKWMKMAERSAPCRPSNQPRIMQVIAMSKPQSIMHGSPKSEGSAVSRSGSIRYKALAEPEPCDGIVHVDAHPENRPNAEPGGSWRWKPPPPERPAARRCFELNDLDRDPESRAPPGDGPGPGASDPHHPHFHHHHHFHHPHHPGMTSIRVTAVESGSEAEAGSETLSLASSRDSTLRRKSAALLAERGPSPDNARHLPHFFKLSPTPPPTVTFKE